MLPQLLVSVCTAAEAIAAIRGGVQIIDIKDPLQGPLGRASVETIRQILSALQSQPGDHRVSAALGETQEWLHELTLEQQDWIAFLDSGPALQYLKLGPAGLLSDEGSIRSSKQMTVQSISNWEVRLNRVRQRLLGDASTAADAVVRDRQVQFDKVSAQVTAEEAGPHHATSWISVAYADWQRCGAPSVRDVAVAAVRQGSCGVLVDTCTKDGSGLFDWCSVAELRQLRQFTRKSRLLMAVAGQLRKADLKRLESVVPDIIAVRGAVCQQGLRTCDVQEPLVREFSAAMQEGVWTPLPPE